MFLRKIKDLIFPINPFYQYNLLSFVGLVFLNFWIDVLNVKRLSIILILIARFSQNKAGNMVALSLHFIVMTGLDFHIKQIYLNS